MNIVPAGGPPMGSPWVPIFSPRGPGAKVEGVILSENLVSTQTHLVGTPPHCRTVACHRRDEEPLSVCHWCMEAWPRRWRGWVGFQAARSGRVGLAEFTAGAARSVQLLDCTSYRLRGKRLELVRASGKRNAKVTATIREWVPHDHSDLPPSPNLEEVLTRIFSSGGMLGP